MLVLGIVAIGAGASERPRVVGVTGLLGMLYTLGGVTYYYIKRSELVGSLTEEEPEEGDLFAGLAQGISDMILETVSLSWGVALLALASIVLLAPLAQRGRRSRSKSMIE